MLSFTKPISNPDGEEIAPAAETTPEVADAGPTSDASSPEVRPLFSKDEMSPTATPADAAYDPAVRNQIQRVRLDLLSRETERLEQQLRQVLEQQNEDRQLREELRGQIANLNQRIESLLAGAASKSAESGGTDGDLRAAVKPLLLAVMEMLDSAEAADLAAPARPAKSSQAWAQIDAARREPVPPATSAPAAQVTAEPAQEVAVAPEADTTDSEVETREPAGREAAEPNSPHADTALATAADPENDLDLDPEAELRIEIARLLRPKKKGGGYGPLGHQAKPVAERTEAEPARPAPPPTAAHGTEPGPLLLGTDQTPVVNDAPPSKAHATDVNAAGAVESSPVSRREQEPGGASDEPKADSAQGALRGGGAVPRSQRPSWAPRPNPMRASLPKCLTEPWEEPSHRPAGRWPFRRTRPAGGRDDPTE